MSTIVTRTSKGSKLSWAEADANFTNLNVDKIEASSIHAATSKITPVDADELSLIDSADSFSLKRLTWTNLKATLKTYLDTLYLGISGNAASATTVTGTIASGVTGTTQAPGDNSTKISTTAYVDAAVAAFPDGVPDVTGHDGETLIVSSGAAAWGRGFKKRTVTSASGSSVGFTSLPSNVDYFQIVLNDVSPSATAVAHICLGVSGSAISSGYDSLRAYIEAPSTVNITAETISISSVGGTSATTKWKVAVEIYSIGSNKWMASLFGYRGGDARMSWAIGNITLSGTLDSLFVVLSTGTFDGGEIALYY